MTKQISIWRQVGLACLLLDVAALTAQEAKRNTLTADEATQGWVLLFDGSTTSGWTSQGDAAVVDGALVIGGPRATRVSAIAPLGSNYELRLEYRTEGGGPIIVGLDWRHLMGSGHVATSLNRLSKNDSEWIEIIFKGQYDPHKNERTVTAKYRALGEPVFATQGIGGGTGDRVTTIGFEMPAGNKLYLRNVKLKTDPVSADWIWVCLGTGLGVLVLLGAAILVTMKPSRLPGGPDRQLSDKKSWNDYPLWVRLCVWGMPNRASVWAICWLALALAVGCDIYGFRDGRFFTGVPFFVVAALTYRLAIRWVDRHGQWL